MQLGGLEPRADLAGIPQLAPFIDADQETAEMAAAAAFAGLPATNNELLAGPDLDLAPYVQRFESGLPVGWSGVSMTLSSTGVGKVEDE
jgi:hypothetical protein